MSEAGKYTVGWISALSLERTAAECLLDEKHDRLSHQVEGDLNDYTLGKMGAHNVVIASLPEGRYGARNAGAVARDMVRTFQNLRFAVMVGIGGGAPTDKNDIRLGDVVVGTPHGTNHEIIQLHCGKAIQNRKFQRIDSQRNTPPLLAAAIAGLKSTHNLYGHELQKIIELGLQKYPRGRRLFPKPNVEEDILYDADYLHEAEGQPCSLVCHRNSDSTHIVQRFRPEIGIIGDSIPRDDPTIHYGPIGSSDALIKDARKRNVHAQEDGILCFETECAGLLEHFPCLVIRGISDYSDTHKNDDWHGYASIAAAAYAKDLLLWVRPDQIDAQKRAAELVENINENMLEVRHKVSFLDSDRAWRKAQETLSLVAPRTYTTKYQDCIQTYHHKSGSWFMKSKEFQDYLDIEGCTLLCLGIPGAGKSILAAVTVNHMKTVRIVGRKIVVTYLFCDYKLRTEQDAEGMLSILLRQLFEQSPDHESAFRLRKRRERSGTRASVNDLTESMKEILKSFEAAVTVCAVIDGLDECRRDGTVKVVMERLFEIQKSTGMRILATSRPIDEVTGIFDPHKPIKLTIRARKEDLKSFVKSELVKIPSLSWLPTEVDLLNDIEISLVEATGDMFLIAKLYVKGLQGCNNKQDVLNALESIRSRKGDIHAAYESTLDRILEQSGSGPRIALHALLWTTFGERNLKTRELEQAVALQEGSPSFDHNAVTDHGRILSLCQGLLELNKPQQMLQDGFSFY